MAHFAELDEDNKVLRVLVFSNDDIAAHGGDLSTEAEQWVATTPSTTSENSITGKPGVSWKQCSYNDNFRGHFPARNYIYDSTNDVFHAPQPHASWILDANYDWKPPIPNPNTVHYGENESDRITSEEWNESLQTFIGVNNNDQQYKWNTTSLIWEVYNG